MTPLAVPPLVFLAALLAACLCTVAAWWLWRHGDVPVVRVVVQPAGVRIVDPVEAPWDWRDHEGPENAA